MKSVRELLSSERWPRWRAGLITLVLFVHACAAMPIPRPVRPEDVRTPTAQDELALWVDIFASLGVQTDADELVGLVNSVGQVCVDVKAAIMGPFRPLLRVTGTGQAWALFAYPDRYPNLLQVEVRRGGADWETVYAAADPDHTFLAEQFSFRRVRGVYDTAAAKGSPGKVYDRFVDWVAREVFERWPDATDVRVKMLQKRVTLPTEMPDEEEPKARLVRLRTREQVQGSAP